jgi:hypothetical protein
MLLTDFVTSDIKMGLFDNIPKPMVEAYSKNKPEWEPHVEGTIRLDTV